MLEFSSPLRSSGFLSSNYTEVLPDASRHCRTQKNPCICTKSAYLSRLGKEMLPSQMLSFASVYANSVLKFHNVSSFFLFCRIAQSRSLTRCMDQQENLDSEEGKLQLRGYLPTAAAFGFCHLILSLSLDSKLSAIS